MAVVLPVGRFDAGPVVTAPATIGLSVLCAGATVLASASPELLSRGALVPAALWAGAPSAWPPGLTVASALVLHDGALHLLYNLAALWVFGPPVERRLGAGPFLALVLGLGALALVAQSLTDPASTVAVLGASGGTAALVGATWQLYPRARVSLALLFLTVPVSVRSLAAVWMAGELAAVTATAAGWAPAVPVAHTAHLVGFVLGAAILYQMARKASFHS